MPTTIRVMNWNIQTFGPMKAGALRNNYDVLEAIAQIVNRSGCDIFVMLEMTTTRRDLASRLALMLLRRLNALGGWDRAVLSPSTGREFYAFFIRSRTRAIPLLLTRPTRDFSGAPVLTLNHEKTLENAVFTAPDSAQRGVTDLWFPLIEPDLPRSGHNLRNPYPQWPGVRRPVLGMFYLPEASAANRILPLVACHYVPNTSIAVQQFRTLPYFKLLRGLAPNSVAPTETAPSPVRTTVNVGSGNRRHTLNYYALLGDFNVDYEPDTPAYAAITYDGLGRLDATGQIEENTFLVNYRDYSRDQKTTSSLAVRNFDNFFTRIAPAMPPPATFTRPWVIDVPNLVQQRRIRLRESVRYYAELDQRGFATAPYPHIVNDYARQIAGDRSHAINTPGALVGGRLISDHLPTMIDITVN
jgi:endonuclease/exonuclease/phosphatase family metal-dependent hydrolase